MKITNKSFEIFFKDFNEDTQKKLLKFMGATKPAEMFFVTLPIVVIPLPEAKEEIPTSPLKKSDLTPGTQILYIPSHANGDPNHKDCEAGFVTSVMKTKDAVFCRYWSKQNPNELRTKANSEITPIVNLYIKKTKPQDVVKKLLKKIEAEGSSQEWDTTTPSDDLIKKKEATWTKRLNIY